MNDYQLGVVEARFAEIIWEKEPISSTELCRQSEQLLQWKKSTCYTVLKRLCHKGIFQNNGGCVTSRISKEEFQALQSERFVEESFGGSLPAFLTAFTARKNLTAQEVQELRNLIEGYEEKN